MPGRPAARVAVLHTCPAARRRGRWLRAVLLLSSSPTCLAFHPGVTTWGGSLGGRRERSILGGSGPSSWRHPPRRSTCHTRLCDAPSSSGGQVDSSAAAAAASAFQLSSEEIEFGSLFVMDVVLFTRRQGTSNDSTTPTTDSQLELGAVQENGNVAPLSAWTLETAYSTANGNDAMEFVVDEEDLYPGLSSDDVRVWRVLGGDAIGYGSRQVGGGKGPGNPHGEESELLYYIDRDVVEGAYCRGGEGGEVVTIDVAVNPSLEHLW